MSNRYVTEKEKQGIRRRQNEYHQRLKAAGQGRHTMITTEMEVSRLRQILDVWRGDVVEVLNEQQIEAANLLKPNAE